MLENTQTLKCLFENHQILKCLFENHSTDRDFAARVETCLIIAKAHMAVRFQFNVPKKDVRDAAWAALVTCNKEAEELISQFPKDWEIKRDYMGDTYSHNSIWVRGTKRMQLN